MLTGSYGDTVMQCDANDPSQPAEYVMQPWISALSLVLSVAIWMGAGDASAESSGILDAIGVVDGSALDLSVGKLWNADPWPARPSDGTISHAAKRPDTDHRFDP